MNYLQIKNAGEIEPRALHLVGASSKRGDSTKIGQFGSGNKFALAFLMRNRYELQIYSGERRIAVDIQQEEFRGQQFNRFVIDGELTSITTEMGKDWELWQAIREIYCNALDEGGCEINYVSRIEPAAGQTHFYISTREEITDFMLSFDNYFATKKTILFECKAGRILKKSGTLANIYRRGIRCFNTARTSIYDYDFRDIHINESRIVEYPWQVEERMWDLLFQCTNKEVILQVLHGSGDKENLEHGISDVSTISAANISQEFKDVLSEINIAPFGFAGLLKPDELHNHVIIPTKVFEKVRGILDDDNVGDRFKVGKKGAIFRPLEPGAGTELQEYTLSKALEFLKEVQYQINFPVCIAIFNDKDVLGIAHHDDQAIYISDVCLAKGINEVVNTIIEENVHLKYGCKDETRDMQTMLIAEFVDYMKRINAYAI